MNQLDFQSGAKGHGGSFDHWKSVPVIACRHALDSPVVPERYGHDKQVRRVGAPWKIPENAVG